MPDESQIAVHKLTATGTEIRYILQTTADAREGTFFTMAEAQTRDAGKQRRILDRLLFANQSSWGA